jgi:hypothetical protein
MPGTDYAAQRPLRLHRPDRLRVALGRVLVVGPGRLRRVRAVDEEQAPLHRKAHAWYNSPEYGKSLAFRTCF